MQRIAFILMIVLLAFSNGCQTSTHPITQGGGATSLKAAVGTPRPEQKAPAYHSACPQFDAQRESIIERKRTFSLLSGAITAMGYEKTGKARAPLGVPASLQREHLDLALQYAEAGCCKEALSDVYMIEKQLSVARNSLPPPGTLETDSNGKPREQVEMAELDECTVMVNKIKIKCEYWKQ